MPFRLPESNIIELYPALQGHLKIELGVNPTSIRSHQVLILPSYRRGAQWFTGYYIPVWIWRFADKGVISIRPDLQYRFGEILGVVEIDKLFEPKILNHLREALCDSTLQIELKDISNQYILLKPPKPPSFSEEFGEIRELTLKDKSMFVKNRKWFGPYSKYWSSKIKQTRVFTIFDGDLPISTCYTMAESDYACSIAVFTHDDYQRLGLGRAVVAAATRATYETGKVTLYVATQRNEASCGLAESLGFHLFAWSWDIKTRSPPPGTHLWAPIKW